MRRKKNEDTRDRNAERRLKHAKHIETRGTVPDTSDDESLITVSSVGDADTSPALRLQGVMSKLSPGSVKDLLRALPFFGNQDKHAREEETDRRKAAKRIREEIVLHPGMSLPVSFHSQLFDLHLINSSSATLTARKLNAMAPGQKQPLILDTEAFEQKFLRKMDLDCAQWIEASWNYVSFIEEASLCREHPLELSLRPFRARQEGLGELLCNSCHRHALAHEVSLPPLPLRPTFYAHKLDQAMGELRLQQLEAWLSGTSLLRPTGGHGSVPSGGNSSGRSGRGGGPGGPCCEG
ncbi:hypothetical protein DFH09DRAFT_1309382 [Mycena vulgaris]|nr:hypothetical protein DFH09DRAFT_1309382 [Mycena vulgaris]